MNFIASRTPEGEPLACSLCGKVAAMEVSNPPGDAICPSCGHLLWWFRDRIERLDLPIQPRILTQVMAGEKPVAALDGMELATDSIGLVELVLELEEEFNLQIPPDKAEQFQNVAQAVRWIVANRPPGTE